MADDAKHIPVDPDLLEEAGAKGVDVESIVDRALRRELAARRTQAEDDALAERFKNENADFIREYREFVEQEGVWNEQWRTW